MIGATITYRVNHGTYQDPDWKEYEGLVVDAYSEGQDGAIDRYYLVVNRETNKTSRVWVVNVTTVKLP